MYAKKGEIHYGPRIFPLKTIYSFVFNGNFINNHNTTTTTTTTTTSNQTNLKTIVPTDNQNNASF